MTKIAFYDTKPYDRIWFDRIEHPELQFKYYDNKLNEETAELARGCGGAVAFVNDDVGKGTIDELYEQGVRVLAMRCAGYNNIDFKAAYKKINVVHVPAYSPYAVAEHAMALLLSLNRKTHKAYARTRDYNFSLNGLIGFDLRGKTIGVIGTGKIGKVFIEICGGFGLDVLAYDPYPDHSSGIRYVELEELFRESDVISLHCPLTEETKHMVNQDTIETMKDGVYIINTSRGALIESEALLRELKCGKVGAAALDVYEEESEFFFEDFSNVIVQDDVLSLLVAMPNVLVTSHQAFLTDEALEKIAQTTIDNLNDFLEGRPLTNEICYKCKSGGVRKGCTERANGRCF